MKVIWKGDPDNRAHVLHWHDVHFLPGKETELPDDFPSLSKLGKNPYFTVVAEKPAPLTMASSPQPTATTAKTGKA